MSVETGNAPALDPTDEGEQETGRSFVTASALYSTVSKIIALRRMMHYFKQYISKANSYQSRQWTSTHTIRKA